MRDLAPCRGDVALRPTPEQRFRSESLDVNGADAGSASASHLNRDVCADDPQSDSPANEGDLSFTEPEFIPRRLARSNRGYHLTICTFMIITQCAVLTVVSCCALCPRRNYRIFLLLAVAFSFRRGGMR